MKTFPTIEDYLEVLAGKRDLITGILRPTSWLGHEFKPIVSLARYDVNFLDSVTNTTCAGNALTDRQAELSVKLVQKYHRQLANKGIELANVDPPRFRNPLRIVDRTKSVYIVEGVIELKFPYDNKLIEYIRAMAKESQGALKFDKDIKRWQIALTEYNLNWVHEMARQYEFEISDEITDLMNRILDMEKQGYAIQLVDTGAGYTINNASNSLIRYLEEHGGLGYDNKYQLADLAPVLGYTVSAEIEAQIEAELGGSAALLIKNREYDMHNAPDAVERIVKYAEATNRWPIVAYNPTPDETLDDWMKYFKEDEVFVLKNKKESHLDILPHHKVIYTHKPLRYLDSIPLLISHSGMLVGFDKQFMVGRTEKIIYAGVKLKS